MNGEIAHGVALLNAPVQFGHIQWSTHFCMVQATIINQICENQIVFLCRDLSLASFEHSRVGLRNQ